MTVRLRLRVFVILAASLFSASRAATLSLIPEPQEITPQDGSFILTADTALHCPPRDKGCAWIAGYFTDLMRRTRQVAPRLASQKAGGIVFERRAMAPEAYRLAVSPDRVVVSARTDAGLFYGAVTLWQLATQQTGPATGISIPAVTIVDAPRFAWRGLLLDSARHFQSPAFIKSFIDAMALHKLNVLQWHLTDDQGWRLEIKRYPRLTGIGAWRTAADGRRYGGFYTQAEVRDIVAYARRRHVTIVPEIEMPGHALAAIVSYPQLGSVTDPPKDVSGDWGVFPYLYNTDPATFHFLENVLGEVMALFPGRDIHVGGDEAVKDQWNASPRIRAQMRHLGIANADDLQTWFTNRIGGFLAAHHRRLVGWDEVLNPKLAHNAVITSWHNINTAIQGARLGHDIVLSPSPALYLDSCQADAADVPPCRGIFVSLKDVYDFDPAPAALTPREQKHLIGVQANIWTEHMPRQEEVDYAAFPRAAALAEVAWSARRDWNSFLARMPAQLARYRALGLVYSDEAFKAVITAAPNVSGARLSLSNQSDYGDIRFTRDGSVPTASSTLYTAPFDTALPVTIGAATFDGETLIAPPMREVIDPASLLRRDSHQMEQCSNDLPLSLAVNDHTVLVNVMNPCWIYKALDLSGVTGFDVAVAPHPFKYQIGADINKIPLHPDAPPQGALEIRLDGCQGEILATMSLSEAGSSLTALHAGIAPHHGAHDLCLIFARRSVDPVWMLDWVQPIRSSP